MSFADITDGLSNTLMVGEKHVPEGRFGVGWLDSSIYNGNYTPPTCRSAGPDAPLAKTRTEISCVFGSYHPSVCQFTFCDGSVHGLSPTIDLDVLGRLACRNDGEPVGNYEP